MEQLKNLAEKDTITSLELLEQINFFRKEEGKKKDLRHDTLLNIIRDEFEEEIQAQKILELFRDVEVGNKAIKKSPYYILSLSQAKQVLMRESKFVRRAVIHYIEELENKLLSQQNIDLADLKKKIDYIDYIFKIYFEEEETPKEEKKEHKKEDICRIPPEYKYKLLTVNEFLKSKFANPKYFNYALIEKRVLKETKERGLFIGKAYIKGKIFNTYPEATLNRIYSDIEEKQLILMEMNLFRY